MLNEAVFCLHENLAKPEDIDTVMKLGMAHPMGPLALADLIGLERDMEVVGEAGSTADALHRIPAARPDVAVLEAASEVGGAGALVGRLVERGAAFYACLSDGRDPATFGKVREPGFAGAGAAHRLALQPEHPWRGAGLGRVEADRQPGRVRPPR